MDKYIGFDIDCKKTVVCVVQKDEKEIYATIGPDVGAMKKQRKADIKTAQRPLVSSPHAFSGDPVLFKTACLPRRIVFAELSISGPKRLRAMGRP